MRTHGKIIKPTTFQQALDRRSYGLVLMSKKDTFCSPVRLTVLIKKLSQLFQTLARPLVQHYRFHRLTPKQASMGCAGSQGLRGSTAITWLKKTPFLQPSLPCHGTSPRMGGSNVLPWHPSRVPSIGCPPQQAWVCKGWRSGLHTCWSTAAIPPGSGHDTIIHNCCICSTCEQTILPLV